METKKNPKANLQTRRVLFLEIGLVVSIALMIAIFSYGKPEKATPVKFSLPSLPDVVILPPIIPEKSEPVRAKPMVVFIDTWKVLPNDAHISTEIDPDVWGQEPIVLPPRVEEKPVADPDEIFLDVSDMPTFRGGPLTNFRNWVMSQLRYPALAAENDIQGQVVVSFVIEKDGTLSNINVLQSPDRLLTEETVRVLKESPKWEPGRQRTTPVRVSFNMPVQFRLSDTQ